MGKLKTINGLARIAALMAGAVAPANAQYGGAVYELARVGGDIVGSAFVCGVAQERTGALGRVVLTTLGSLNPAEAQRAQQTYGDFVQRGAARQLAEGDATCATTLAKFDALEAQFVAVDGQPQPAPQLRYGFQAPPAPAAPEAPAEPPVPPSPPAAP
jgi:hypothetical protein